MARYWKLNVRDFYLTIRYTYTVMPKSQADKCTDEMKKYIRRYMTPFNLDPFTYSEDELSRYERYECDWVLTPEEIKQEICDTWVQYKLTGYDCTGQWYTRRIKVFPLPACGKTVVYHFQERDL